AVMLGYAVDAIAFTAFQAALVIPFGHHDIAHGVVTGYAALGAGGVVAGQQLVTLALALQAAQRMDAGIDGLARSIGAGDDQGTVLFVFRQRDIGLGDGLIAARTVAGLVAVLIHAELIGDGQHLIQPRQGLAGLAGSGQLHGLAQPFGPLALDVAHEDGFHAVFLHHGKGAARRDGLRRCGGA